LDGIPNESHVWGYRKPTAVSGTQITLDLIGDAGVDGKQAGLVELGLSNKQGRVLSVVIAQLEAEQFSAPDPSCEQENNRQPNHFGAEWRGRRPRQAGSCPEEPRHFGLREDVRIEPLMALRECVWIWKETLWLGPAAIEAEIIDVQHPAAARTRSESLMSLAPSSKSCGAQVRI
jgi:hypothetical protein